MRDLRRALGRFCGGRGEERGGPGKPGAASFSRGVALHLRGGLRCQRAPRPFFPLPPSEVEVGAAARDPGPESFPLTMNFSISDSD